MKFSNGRLSIFCLSLLIFLLVPVHRSESTKKIHAIAARGIPKYKKGFTHFDFANPDAPKKGKIVLGEIGSFDSLNPWILKGVAAKKINLTRATLMGRSPEEPFTMYGVVAETMEVADDRSWIIFNLRADAKWETGASITADDVIFSHKTWLTYGQPYMKTFYKKVKDVEKLGPLRVKFTFYDDQKDREQPLIIGLMPLIPKYYYEGKDLNQIALQPLVSNGPYRIKSYEPGRFIVYERIKDFWGKNLPTYKGRYNFDEVRIDYFLSRTVLFEAFKSGKIDIIEEEDPQKWSRDYKFSEDKNIKKEEIEHKRPVGLHSLVFNTRREPFNNILVRKALIKVFDFERLNRALYNDLYTRTRSFFDHTELMPRGNPSPGEMRVLKPYMDQVDPSVLGQAYAPPVNTTSKEKRKNMMDALNLLKEAGYEIKEGRLVNSQTGSPFQFEIIVPTKDWVKSVDGYIRDLSRLGIKVFLRVLDQAQYQRRKADFDYDMIYHFWLGTRFPGNELINYISSKSADINGSRNYPGIRDRVIDDLIQKIIRAETRTDLISLVRVLDRILMAGHYVLPLFHLEKDLIAYKDTLSYPKLDPAMESRIESWWESQ